MYKYLGIRGRKHGEKTVYNFWTCLNDNFILRKVEEILGMMVLVIPATRETEAGGSFERESSELH